MKKLFTKKSNINLAQYSEEVKKERDPNAFKNMTRLIEMNIKQIAKFEEITEKRSKVFDIMQKLARVDIPELAKSIGQMIYKLPDGKIVEITSKLEANVPKKNEVKVYRWLENNGAGSIIKKVIIIEFDKTEQGQYDFEFAERTLREKDIKFSVKQAVNKATLEKHLRECREKGVKLDEKLFGMFDVYDTVIDKKKTPKK